MKTEGIEAHMATETDNEPKADELKPGAAPDVYPERKPYKGKGYENIGHVLLDLGMYLINICATTKSARDTIKTVKSKLFKNKV